VLFLHEVFSNLEGFINIAHGGDSDGSLHRPAVAVELVQVMSGEGWGSAAVTLARRCAG
jgi:hypothetical protein